MVITKSDWKHLTRASRLALKSNYSTKIKIGAVVVDKRGNTYGGYNSNKSSPMQSRYNRRRFKAGTHDTVAHRTHAEIAAIKKAIGKRANLTGATIYVVRLGLGDSEYGMCRPCKACMGAIIAVGITDIFFTTEHGIAHEYVL